MALVASSISVVTSAASATAQAADVSGIDEVPLIDSPELLPASAEFPAGAAGGALGGPTDELAGGERDDAAAAVAERQAATAAGRRSEVVSERAANRRVFEHADGVTEVELSTEPLTYDAGAGDWRPVDTRVVPKGSSPSDGFRSAENAWTAHFDSVDGRAGGLSIATSGHTVGLVPRDASAVDPRAVATDASAVRFAAVWRDTDLEYRVHASGVKEDIVVHSANAPRRFEFDVTGAVARQGESGGLQLTGPAGPFAIPAVSLTDAAGADVTAASGATLEAIDEGTGVAVTVDSSWLAELSEQAFPVRVDPTIQPVVPSVYAQSWPSNGGAAVSGLRVGRDSAGVMWRGQVGFDYEAYIDHPYALVGAALTLSRTTGPEGPSLQIWAPTAQSYAGTRGFAAYNGAYMCEPDTGCAIGPRDAGSGVEFASPPHVCNECHVRVKQNVLQWFEDGVTDAKIGVVPFSAATGQIVTYQATLRLYLQEPPPAATLTAPADGSVLATRTPTLTASPVTFTDELPVRYRFDVSTGPTGGVVSSGWLEQPSWTVPGGSLKDGATYVATVRTASAYMLGNNHEGVASPATSVRRFRVDMGLGVGGAAPTERAGTVAGVTGTPAEGSPSPATPGAELNVNMIDGNLAAAVPTHSVTATAGDIEPTLVYNSLADSDAGLTGEYYSDDDSDRTFDSSDTLRARRLDAVVSFDWPQIDEIVGGMPAEADALIRWSGFVRVPESGSWQLGLDVDGYGAGGRVFLADEATPAVDDWDAVPALSHREVRFGAPREFTAGALVPIRIEFWGDFAGGIKLLAKRGETSWDVPQSWLSTGGTGLPRGWHLSAGAQDALDVIAVEDVGDSVLVLRSDGSTAAFTRQPGGGYSPPEDDDSHLAVDGEGRLTLSTTGGLTYRFRPDGAIEHVTTVADDRRPAALEYQYGGTPVRLQSISDPVSGREVTFSYGEGACTAPSGMLCRISFWDGASSTLVYDSSGRLVRVSNPGYETASGQDQPTLFDFGYDANGRVVSIRDPLAADLVAYGTRADGADLRTNFVYDGADRLTSITPPLAAPGDEPSTTTYAYDVPARTTTVQVAGFTPATGFARRVRWDAAGRIVEQTDAAGLSTVYAWSADGRVVARTDPGDIRSTFGYDMMGNRTDVWGPAPSNQFGADNRPIAGASVPHTSTSYDDGMAGLAASYWSNPHAAGPPAGHGSGAELAGTWGGSPPVAPDEQGRWSMRLTGFVRFGGGATTFAPDAGSGGVRVWVDDVLVLDNRAGLADVYTETNGEGAWHRIRVDYVNESPSSTLNVRWHPEGAPAGEYTAVPPDALRPGFGLETRAVDADGKVTATEYNDPSRHIGPHHRLATATVLDPDGLALRTTLRYEDPTVGGFLRRSDQVMPSGAATTTEYYGDSAEPVAATCGVTASTHQGGFVREVRHPDPDGDGPQQSLVQQFVYDATGREAGTRRGDATSIDSAPWSCTVYDGRGRRVIRTYPTHGDSTARATVWSFAVDGDPLSTRVSEPFDPSTPSVSTTVDVRNRLVSYRSQGGESLRLYDRLGRAWFVTDNGVTTISDYDPSDGRLSQTTVLDGGIFGPPPAQHTITAVPTYDPRTGKMTKVDYSNGTASEFVYDLAGRQAWTVHRGPDGAAFAGDLVGRSPAGRVTEQVGVSAAGLVDHNPEGDNFFYDGAGRVIAYHGDSGGEFHLYGEVECGAPGAGRNTNKTLIARDGQIETYCYDAADRLVSGSDIASAEYDTHGNTTALGDVEYLWDAADRHIGIRSPAGDVDYVRDSVGRISQRETGGASIRYLYGGFGDVPTAAASVGTDVAEWYVTLPGGVSITMSGNSTDEKWAYPNTRGDIAAVANETGTPAGGLSTYGPWGEGPVPDTTAGERDQGFVGASGRWTEQGSGFDVIDMGARPYLPDLGRFLTRDPVQGGCANDYAYVYGDPVNTTDVSGRFCVFGKNPNGSCRNPLRPIGNAARCVGRVFFDYASPQPSKGTAVTDLGLSVYAAGKATLVLGGPIVVGGTTVAAGSTVITAAGGALIVVGTGIVLTGVYIVVRDNC